VTNGGGVLSPRGRHPPTHDLTTLINTIGKLIESRGKHDKGTTRRWHTKVAAELRARRLSRKFPRRLSEVKGDAWGYSDSFD
jgi:hypothetical protein